MPATWVRDHTSGTSTTAGTTVTVTLAADVPAGNFIRVAAVFDNLSFTTPTVSTISKPGGESASWVQLEKFDSNQSLSANGVRGEDWGIATTQLWASGTVITVTLSGSVTAKAAVCQEFNGLSTTLRGTVASGTSAVGTPTATTTGTTPVTGDIVFGLGGWERNAAGTGDSDTTNGSWSTALTAFTASGSSAANVSALVQYKILTSGGNQTFNPTGGTTADCGCCVVALVPIPTPNPPTSLTATGNSNSIPVAWTAPGSGQTPDSYNVYRYSRTLRYSESFNKADSTVIGPDLTWTEMADVTIVSNKVRSASASSTFASARAEHDMTSPDMAAEVVVATLASGATATNDAAACVRFDAASTTPSNATFYSAEANNGSTTGITLYKTVSGVRTQLGSTVANPAGSVPYTLRCEAFGTTIQALVNGQVVITATDSQITTGTRAGFFCRWVNTGNPATAAAVEIDSFAAYDIEEPSLDNDLLASVSYPTTTYDDNTAVTGVTYTYFARSSYLTVESTDSNTASSALTTAGFVGFGVPL